MVDCCSNGNAQNWIGSTRFPVAIVMFFGFVAMSAVRSTISVGIVCMVNHTAVKQLARMNYTDDSGIECSNSSLSQKFSYQEGSAVWSKEIQGLILSSVYWGYIVIAIPSGMLVTKYGARMVFGITTAVSSLATLLIPICSTVSPYLVIVLRVINGFCHGVAFPAGGAIWAAWAPPLERSRLINFSFAGSQVGTVVILMVSGVICDHLGWPWIFYISGIGGLIWCIFWFIFAYDTPEDHPRISDAEKKYIQASLLGQMSKMKKQNLNDVPWSKVLMSIPMWALHVAIFCLAWSYLSFVLIVPSYINDVLYLDIKTNGILASLSNAMMWLFVVLSGIASDYLIGKFPTKITWIRKVFLCAGLILTSIFIVILGFLDCSNVVSAIIFLFAGMAMMGCSAAVSYCAQVDIAPRFAGLLAGFAAFFLALASLIGPAVAGKITKHQTREEWQVFFYISAGIGIFGSVVYLFLGSAEVQSWAEIEQPAVKDSSELKLSKLNLEENEKPLLEKEL